MLETQFQLMTEQDIRKALDIELSGERLLTTGEIVTILHNLDVMLSKLPSSSNPEEWTAESEVILTREVFANLIDRIEAINGFLCMTVAANAQFWNTWFDMPGENQ